jgi:hypothetical protein
MLLQTHLILRNALSSIWPMRLGDTPTIFAVAARVSAGEAKPDPQADNLLLMRFQHRDQPLDGSMVGDRPLYIARLQAELRTAPWPISSRRPDRPCRV